MLLDTNALLWLLDDKKSHNLGKSASNLILKSEVYASSLSLSEIAIKTMLKKLRAPVINAETLSDAGMLELDYKLAHAERIYDFQSLAQHDPFDRMLLAQAVAEDMTFMTADKTLLALELDCVVDARE